MRADWKLNVWLAGRDPRRLREPSRGIAVDDSALVKKWWAWSRETTRLSEKRDPRLKRLLAGSTEGWVLHEIVYTPKRVRVRDVLLNQHKWAVAEQLEAPRYRQSSHRQCHAQRSGAFTLAMQMPVLSHRLAVPSHPSLLLSL
jgi:hypothetical protein